MAHANGALSEARGRARQAGVPVEEKVQSHPQGSRNPGQDPGKQASWAACWEGLGFWAEIDREIALSDLAASPRRVLNNRTMSPLNRCHTGSEPDMLAITGLCRYCALQHAQYVHKIENGLCE